MDDDDFEDLLGEAEMLQDVSTVSLTGTAANLSFAENADGPSTSLHTGFSRLRTASPIPRSSRQDDSTFYRPEHATDTLLPTNEAAEESDNVANRSPPPPYAPKPNAAVVERIEQAYEEIVDALLNEKTEISITLKIRNSQSRSQRGPGDLTTSTRRLCFPGKTADEAWRFSVVIRIMELIHEALRSHTVISKRDIYYRDPALFGQQKHVDRYVDDIAFTFGVTRSSLNVAAAAKGLVTGPITFYRRDGATVNAATEPEGLLVPNVQEILSVNMTAVKWILVVEKEATFRSIAASEFWKTACARGVLLTGKGYPDLATRALLRLLSTTAAQNGFASPPVFGLADFDPDGIAILNTYKHGSKALSHETESHEVPQLQWLGLRSEHLQLATKDAQAAQGLLTLSCRDRKRAVKMLEQSFSSASDDNRLFQNELQTMLMLNVKAELQLFDAIPHGMAEFLRAHFGKL